VLRIVYSQNGIFDLFKHFSFHLSFADACFLKKKKYTGYFRTRKITIWA